MYEYLVPSWERFQPDYEKAEVMLRPFPSVNFAGNRRIEPLIDRSPKLYIGRQTDAFRQWVQFYGRGFGRQSHSETGLGNRKDIRNAVEAAAKSGSWARTTAHLRGQILYYLGENLSVRATEFSNRLVR